MDKSNIIIKNIETNEISNYSVNLKEAYPELYEFFYPSRLKWLPKFNGEQYPIVVATVNDVYAAWVWSMISPVFTQNKIYENVALSINTFTLNEFRNRGIGSKLQDFNQKQYDMLWSISMSTPNRRNREKLGWEKGPAFYCHCGRINKFDSLLLTQPLLEYCKRHKKNILYLVMNFFLCIGGRVLAQYLSYLFFKRLKRQQLNDKLRFEEINSFDEEWNKLWSSIYKNYDFGVYKNSNWMNWNYINQPHLNFYCYKIYFESNYIGIIVFRAFAKGECKHGIITEVLLMENYNYLYDDAIIFAIDKLKNLNCDYVYIGTGNKEESKKLEKIRFKVNSTNIPMYKITNVAKDKDLSISMKSEKWIMSMGDHDMSQYMFNRHPSIISILLSIKKGKLNEKNNN